MKKIFEYAMIIVLSLTIGVMFSLPIIGYGETNEEYLRRNGYLEPSEVYPDDLIEYEKTLLNPLASDFPKEF